MDAESAARLEAVAQCMADEGQLLEGGWVIVRGYAVHLHASELQLREMRIAYMAGSQHTFAVTMAALANGNMRILGLLDAEIETFKLGLRGYGLAGGATYSDEPPPIPPPAP